MLLVFKLGFQTTYGQVPLQTLDTGMLSNVIGNL